MLRWIDRPGYVVLEINHPPVNILNAKLLEELRAALARVAATDARAMLLCGDGKFFSAGADVGEHLPGKVEDLIPLFMKTIQDLVSLEIPTVAHVHGAALGGGFELAMACDFVVAAENTRLGLPEITLGVFPLAAAAVLPVQIGLRRALELMLTGESIRPAAAAEIGLINRVGDAGEAVKLLESLVRHPRCALVACKRAARQLVSERLAFAESVYLNELMAHPEPVEGLRAFIEKRLPAWSTK